MFIGRKKELEALNAFYEGDKEALACVSGALGMGKTTLLRHFADGKKAIYFHAYETTGKQELSMLRMYWQRRYSRQWRGRGYRKKK